MKISDIIEEGSRRGASDIHITEGGYLTYRVNGELVNETLVTREQMDEIEKYIMEGKGKESEYREKGQCDLALEETGIRLRVHMYRERGRRVVAMRIIPVEVPNLRDLGVPDIVRELAEKREGLVLITGVTGSGKSTTLAGMIKWINERYSKHIVTIEDPIEYIHRNEKSLIHQREVGSDVSTFVEATRGAMREDPDIILLGEMRDIETISNAITLAETGHLVFATLHTKSAVESVDRIVDVFPGNQQEQIRIQLANSLQGVVAQELVVSSLGGRVVSCEVMIVTDALRNGIRTKAGKNSLKDMISNGSHNVGSQTKIQSLEGLVREGRLRKEDALRVVQGDDYEELQKRLKYIKE